MQAWLKTFGQWLPGSRPAKSESEKMASAPLIAIENLGRAVWGPRNFAAFAREGMMLNPIVYRCIRTISEAAASVPLRARGADGAVLAEHGLLSLLRSPAAGQVGADLLETAVGYLLVSGNLYVEALPVAGQIKQLHVLRPDRIRVVPDADGWPAAYEYGASADRTTISGDVVPGVGRILHMKLFHPLDDHYGLSPIEAAATAIDIHNSASRWNKALLDNAARPSGALVYTTGGQLTAEQFSRLKGELEENFQGARNAGRPLLLEGGLDWKSMSLTPRDMDFIDAKHAAARDIALSLGVPPMLLGIPGDNTYANMQEANRVFWRQTVIPLVQKTAAALGGWLAPGWPDVPVTLEPDFDRVEALRSEREALWKRLEGASFLTMDEKRAAVGFGPMEGRPQA